MKKKVDGKKVLFNVANTICTATPAINMVVGTVTTVKTVKKVKEAFEKL